MQNILITCAAWVVISAISSGFSFWKGVDHGKALEKDLCQSGQQAAGVEDVKIKKAQDEVLNNRPDDSTFSRQLRDPRAKF